MIFYTIENDLDGATFVRGYNNEGEFSGQYVKSAFLINAGSDSDHIAHQICAELELGEPAKIDHDKNVIFFEVQ